MTAAAGLRRRDLVTHRITDLASPSIIVADAVQTWWNEPRAIFHAGGMLYGSQTHLGDVVISRYDLATGQRASFVLDPALEVEDHDNPSLLILPDGRLRVFWAKHTGANIDWARTRATTSPITSNAALSSWGATALITANLAHPTLTGWTYPKPFMLGAEGNRCYLHFRSRTAQQAITYSDDITADTPTWSTATCLFDPLVGGKRPYFNFVDNGVDTAWLFTGQDHPVTTDNDVLAAVYTGGNLYKSDGTLIGPLSAGFTAAQATKVYDHTTAGKTWLWDVTLDGSGRPHVAFAVFPAANEPAADNHRYWAARQLADKSWRTAEICGGGGDFHVNPLPDGAQYYSGGVTLSKADPNTAIVSRQKSTVGWGLEQWQTTDDGVSWHFDRKISESDVKNVRPFFPHHPPAGFEDLVGWMRGRTDSSDGAVNLNGGYYDFVRFYMDTVVQYRFPVA